MMDTQPSVLSPGGGPIQAHVEGGLPVQRIALKSGVSSGVAGAERTRRSAWVAVLLASTLNQDA